MYESRIKILDVTVHNMDVKSLHEHIAALIQNNGHGLILHVNVHCLNLACRLPWLRDFLNNASIVLCDGAGVMLGARLLGNRIRQRMTGAEWTWQLAEFAESQGFTLFLVGSRPGVAARAAQRLQERYRNLRIVGTHHGYFDKNPGSAENEMVIQKINSVRPHILLVGFGMPLQERWLMDNWDHISANVALTGGGIFDYVSGELRRAPRWLTDHGLEWLGRLCIEPRRLWKRYLLGNPIFLWRVLNQRLRQLGWS